MPLNDLERRIRKSREFSVPIDRFTFKVLRPTTEDMMKYRADGMTVVEVIRQSVIGWSGVKESDIVPQGVEDEAPFDYGVWSAWISDRDDLWGPLGNAITDAYEKHKGFREEEKKD